MGAAHKWGLGSTAQLQELPGHSQGVMALVLDVLGVASREPGFCLGGEQGSLAEYQVMNELFLFSSLPQSFFLVC